MTKQNNSPFDNFGSYVGSQLRQARKLRKLSQKELANSLKSPISCQQIQKYEKGKNQIPLFRLVEMAEILKLPIGYFLPQGYYHFEGDAELISDFYAMQEIYQKVMLTLVKKLKQK